MSIQFYSEITAELSLANMIDGDMFRWFQVTDIVGTGAKDFLFKTPSEGTFLFYGRALEGSGSDGDLRVYTNPTFSDEGTLLTESTFNMNSTSNNQSGLQAWENPVITDVGNFIDIDQIFGTEGSGNKGSLGSQTSQEFPRIFPKDTYVLSRITNFINQNTLNVVYKLFWAEVRD